VNLSRKALCYTYGLIALTALVCTWGNVLGLLGDMGFWGGTLQFWQDVLVNPSSRFVTADILFLMLAVFFWMVLEARRLQMPLVWGYIVFSILIGPSIGLPLFMIHRELRLAGQPVEQGGGRAGALDIAGLCGVAVLFTLYSGYALTL
jgi:hypothetical protein